MKKMIAVLMALCVLCAAGASLADMEIPDWESMPEAVTEDENTKVEEKAFEGEWVLKCAFANKDFVDEQTLAGTYGYNFMPFVIGEGKIKQDIQQENGEFVTKEAAYTLEHTQLIGTDWNGRTFVVDLLVDGNIALAWFFPGEGDTQLCLTVFLAHPEK